MEFECPYCGNNQKVDPDYLEWSEGDEKEITCKNCDKIYDVHGYTTVTYEVHERDDQWD